MLDLRLMYLTQFVALVAPDLARHRHKGPRHPGSGRQSLTKKTVLVIGLPPSVAGVDTFPGITAETMNLARAADTASLAQAGFAVDFSCIDVRTPPVEGVHGRLPATHCDDTVIGAGVRTDTNRFALFEQRVNLVHEKVPSARICVNTKPGDTADGVRRRV